MTEWYYLKGGRQHGPVPERSIRAWLESGFLDGSDLLWASGMGAWTPISEIAELGGRPAPAAPIGLPAESHPLGGEPAGVPAVAYAGFWLRAVAYLIDSLILSIPMAILWLPRVAPNDTDVEKLTRDPEFLLVGFVLSWLYFAILESSPWQATLGKRLLRLRVTDLRGQRLGFIQASLRQFGKIVSSLVFDLGWILAGFTPRKQALHDILARCLVVREEGRSWRTPREPR